MHLRLALNTVVYVLSVSAVIAAALNPVGTAKVLRRQATRVAAGVRTVTTTASGPVVSASEFRVRPVAAPRQANARTLKQGEYRVAIGTVVSARLRSGINSGAAHANDQVDATLTAPVLQDGVELIPAGSTLHGKVVDARAGTRKAPLGRVEVVFTVVQHAETRSRAAIQTRPLAFEAQAPSDPSAIRAMKRQPIDIDLQAGHPIAVVLSEPLVVFLPTAR